MKFTSSTMAGNPEDRRQCHGGLRETDLKFKTKSPRAQSSFKLAIPLRPSPAQCPLIHHATLFYVFASTSRCPQTCF